MNDRHGNGAGGAMISREPSPVCQLCGIEAPTRRASFYQYVGLVLWHAHWQFRGYMCKRCVHAYFWRGTLTILTLGWWSIESLVIAPILLVANITHYIASVGLEPAPMHAKPPERDLSVSSALSPFSAELASRLRLGEDLMVVAGEVGARAGVSADQVARHVASLVANPLKESDLIIRRKPRPAAASVKSA